MKPHDQWGSKEIAEHTAPLRMDDTHYQPDPERRGVSGWWILPTAALSLFAGVGLCWGFM
jgi:hypothetical protein